MRKDGLTIMDAVKEISSRGEQGRFFVFRRACWNEADALQLSGDEHEIGSWDEPGIGLNLDAEDILAEDWEIIPRSTMTKTISLS